MKTVRAIKIENGAVGSTRNVINRISKELVVIWSNYDFGPFSICLNLLFGQCNLS